MRRAGRGSGARLSEGWLPPRTGVDGRTSTRIAGGGSQHGSQRELEVASFSYALGRLSVRNRLRSREGDRRDDVGVPAAEGCRDHALIDARAGGERLAWRAGSDDESRRAGSLVSGDEEPHARAGGLEARSGPQSLRPRERDGAGRALTPSPAWLMVAPGAEPGGWGNVAVNAPARTGRPERSSPVRGAARPSSGSRARGGVLGRTRRSRLVDRVGAHRRGQHLASPVCADGVRQGTRGPDPLAGRLAASGSGKADPRASSPCRRAFRRAPGASARSRDSAKGGTT